MYSSKSCFRVRLTSKEFTPNYLNWIVGSEYGKRYFLKSAKQTTGIASINMGQLKITFINSSS